MLHVVVDLQQASLIARAEAGVMYSSVKLLFFVCVQLGCATELSVKWLLTCSQSLEYKKSLVWSSLAVVVLPVGDAFSCKLRYCRKSCSSSCLRERRSFTALS